MCSNERELNFFIRIKNLLKSDFLEIFCYWPGIIFFLNNVTKLPISLFFKISKFSQNRQAHKGIETLSTSIFSKTSPPIQPMY